MSLVVVAAVLSMVGYSLNDTIMIFDRVRENLRKSRRDHLVDDPEPVGQRDAAPVGADPYHRARDLGRAAGVRRAGDPAVCRGDGFGVFTGTFSSMFIAAPALLIIEHTWPGVDGRGVKVPAPRPAPGRGKTQTA